MNSDRHGKYLVCANYMAIIHVYDLKALASKNNSQLHASFS